MIIKIDTSKPSFKLENSEDLSTENLEIVLDLVQAELLDRKITVSDN